MSKLGFFFTMWLICWSHVSTNHISRWCESFEFNNVFTLKVRSYILFCDLYIRLLILSELTMIALFNISLNVPFINNLIFGAWSNYDLTDGQIAKPPTVYVPISAKPHAFANLHFLLLSCYWDSVIISLFSSSFIY